LAVEFFSFSLFSDVIPTFPVYILKMGGDQVLGNVTTANGAIVSDLVSSERRGEGMGYYGLSNNLSFPLDPALGIWLMNGQGFDSLFLVSAILALCSPACNRTHDFQLIGQQAMVVRLQGYNAIPVVWPLIPFLTKRCSSNQRNHHENCDIQRFKM
jgi:hypothetical protein